MRIPLRPGEALAVSLNDESTPGLELCRLSKVQRADHSALEWTPAAIAASEDAGANLAVRQSPLVSGIHDVGQRGFAGLPGWLADSLPDSWGRLLVDRQLRKQGVEPSAIGGVDRLAIVGERGPGALCYEPSVVLEEAGLDDERIDLDLIAEEAEALLTGEAPELLDRLATLGGSAGGSRPKAWIAFDEATGALRSGATTLRAGESGWLVKFRAPAHDPEDVGPLEFAYAQMAKRAGLAVAEPRLFETDRGRYFASRRFDREDGRRLHVLTATAFLDVPHDQAMAADYADLIKLTRFLNRSEVDAEAAFRHACFNVFACNRDDHLKQYAFVRRGERWCRSPAYDLTFSSGPGGEHTLLVGGEGRHPGAEELRRVAEESGIPASKAKAILEQVRAAIAAWRDLASSVDVQRASIARVASALAKIR